MTLDTFPLLLTALALASVCQQLSRRFSLSPRTLANLMEDRAGDDNFLLIRLLAAAAVIYGHSYAVTAFPNNGDHLARLGLGYGIYSGSIAVNVFFFLSGFLVSWSWSRRNDLAEFALARALRILPGYAFCLFATTLLLGASVTTLGSMKYFNDPATLTYFTTNLKFGIDMQWSLPGVFGSNPKPDVVNGSLWTLPAEVRAYLWLAILGLLGVLGNRRIATLVIVGAAVLAFGQSGSLPILEHPMHQEPLGYFALGTLAFLWRDRISVSAWMLPPLLLLVFFSHGGAWLPFMFALTMGYWVLWFAYAAPVAKWINRCGDYSFGLYLWGYPMEQLVASQINAATPLTISLLGLLLALACAVFSWHFIERPALRLRAKFRLHPTMFAPVPSSLPSQ